MSPPNTRPWSLLSFILVALLTSCGSFDRRWNAAGPPPAVPSIEGRWEGTWKSSVTGHTGKLRCVVGSPTTAEGDRAFTYWATWGPFFRASFAALHRVHQKGDTFSFAGEHKMPNWVGGVYSYKGTVDGKGFKATYHSSKDNGVFEMNRPKK